jgi:hypothetical protein
MAERAKDPVLNINPVDPFDPQPTMFQLRFDTPKEFEGKYGPQFAYSVTYNNQDHVLFASKALDEAIQATTARKDDHVAVVRTGEGKDTRWTARLVDASGRPVAVANQRPAPAARPAPAEAFPRETLPVTPRASLPVAPRPKPFVDRLTGYLSDESLYWHAMKRAMVALPEGAPAPSLDLNAVAFVLYKMAKDHGIELGPDGDPILEEDPTPPLDPELQRAVDATLDLVRKLAGAPEDGSTSDDLLAVAARMFLDVDRDPIKTWADTNVAQVRDLYKFVKACRDYAEFLTAPVTDEEMPF